MMLSEDTAPMLPADTPYLDWARLQQQPTAATASQLIPALVRLQADGKDTSAALAALADALLAQEILMDRDDLEDLGLLADAPQRATPPSPRDIFTVFIAARGFAATQSRLSCAVEFLHLGRAIEAPEAAIALTPAPALAEDTAPIPPETPIVAVIDDGIGFLNTRFCRRDLRRHAPARYRTRFHAVWLQAFQTIPMPSYSPAYVQAGQVLHRRDIDALLALGPRLEEEDSYRRLNRQLLEPGAHCSTEFGFTHGTHILALAAGADPESDGPVQDWPLLAVQLPPEAVDNTAGTQLEPCIIDAVRWILRQARRMNDHSPVVINISFATFAGPKDGTKPIEAMVKHLLERWQVKTGRQARLVFAFGNARRNRQSAFATLAPQVAQSVDWCLQPDDFAPSYLELRPLTPADLSRLTLTLTAPDGRVQALPPIPANSRRLIRDAQGRSIGAFYHVGARPSAPGVVTPAHAVLAMAASTGAPVTAAHGRWRLTLAATGPNDLPIRLEVQRGDTVMGYRLNGRQSYLDAPQAYGWDAETADYRQPDSAGPITRAASHSSFATAQSPCIYTVGAARGDTLGPCLYSPDGAAWTVPGPTLSAVADRGTALRGLVASGTFSGSGRALNGTSAAAGVASRLIAQAFADGQIPPPPGMAEAAHLVATYGPQPQPGRTARQGAGVLAPLRQAVAVSVV
ncbi:S8 family serine peptidase [Pseudorhodobacter sp. E13]|uniref:S8 family serine peptidase n=1 Tax=Pseudorhodobacter sp. E13 TaxID=2487931 RepID=UPI000F8F69E2|nr:S8 family serine peptidase [Pseudorhodobacter sp. E13]